MWGGRLLPALQAAQVLLVVVPQEQTLQRRTQSTWLFWLVVMNNLAHALGRKGFVVCAI